MNFELEEHEARYLAFSLAVHIARAEDHRKTMDAWIDESGSRDGDYGDRILVTDENLVSAYDAALDANKEILAKLVSQLPGRDDDEAA